MYRAAASHGIASEIIDRTPLWKVGAMFRPPKSNEDEMLEVFRERMQGEEPEFRSMGMAQVIPLLRQGRPPGAS